MTEKNIAVKVDHVSKFFKLPTEATQSLRTTMVNRLRGIKGYKEQHVLKDISFEVEKGDFFGILGRNGSGKSTLLKIISQIYVPEKGSVTVDGKLVSFIELGVGFNPELTGRENVYLNGALLGFSQEEIDAMYDDIVDFAELRDFMHQKLKNYSSGMQVRLAFSVAIKAQGDILVLDEVLAVGDEAFQRKCNDYFLERKKSGKTTILVTHDMGAVKKYCNKAVLIENGLVKTFGNPDDVANQYSLDNAANLYKNSSRYSHADLELINLEDLEFDVRLLSMENVTIYFDIENQGFSQNNIKQFLLKKSDKLAISIPAGCTRIRVDLSERPSYFTNVIVYDSNSTYEIPATYTNGILNDREAIFPDPDPQLTYDLSKGIDEVVLEYSVKISEKSKESILTQSKETLKEIVEERNNLKIELKKIKEYVEELESKIDKNQ